MGVLTLIGAIAAPKNDEKGLYQFAIVWSNPQKYQKCGVSTVLLIPISRLLG